LPVLRHVDRSALVRARRGEFRADLSDRSFAVRAVVHRFAQNANGAVSGINCVESATLGGRAVYAGGSYFTVVGLPAPVQLARWDGVQWADVGGGVFRFGPPALVSELRAHAEAGGTQLYVGGVFDYAGGPPPLVGGSGIPACPLDVVERVGGWPSLLCPSGVRRWQWTEHNGALARG
jgi:hypothetical protein